jgi:electron transport complex protein RnfD
MASEAKAHELIVSVSPHVRGKETVGRIMWTVNLSLLPAFIMSVYYFGPLAAYVTGLCIPVLKRKARSEMAALF